MDNYREESERLMRESLALREEALDRWCFGTPEAKTCPRCFGATITVLYTRGNEHLKCEECGARGPIYAPYAA
ncbi:MAG: hypothetical protein ACD_81C00045G0001 [uncultured bacterium]|uniref:Uncharacterized protein n=2 Tax=Candidatus Wolfeibacteriota TaxID=1752735 RepID=A0A0G1H9J5_9BACT|nr:MAG: hypothetical protein ACD_81C00045G0001 [uncultured bacterium]KKR12498.1 MAG: hypothetical protein UT41_C0001G0042 [Candidatus Wolfebacteria bacterium GW2011_GWC2_39_22]KKT43455.1 MAG: hypothetical protein UW32_C0001G0047 [Candidatus Wolfebacteria bacterium GW2011_GWE2_44_13]HBI25291.1 hypothetical protein [Candidatus Wolfebacteria bacterium]